MLHIAQPRILAIHSYHPGQTVNEIIARHLPYSATMGILAHLLAPIVLAAGIIAALRQNSLWDYGSMALAMLGLSITGILPWARSLCRFALGIYLFFRRPGGRVSAIALPVITLSAIYAAYIARLTRAGMLEVMRSDYIRTASCRGFDEKTVLPKHALRGGNSGCFIYRTGFYGPLAGTVVVERAFRDPRPGNFYSAGPES